MLNDAKKLIIQEFIHPNGSVPNSRENGMNNTKQYKNEKPSGTF